MSEILENCVSETNTQAPVVSVEQSEDTLSDSTVDLKENINPEEIVKESSESDKEESCSNMISKENVKEFIEFLKEFSSKKQEAIEDFDKRHEYLLANLVKYDENDYFQNDDFKNLYSAVFSKLGTNLDTERFIKLVDKYVNSRLEAISRKNTAKQENDILTGTFDFKSGDTKQTPRKLRMQDIPENELEKYISIYL